MMTTPTQPPEAPPGDALTQAYITNNENRAKWLFGIFVGLIILSMGFYILLHTGILTCDPDPGWCNTDKTIWQQRALDWILWAMFGTLLYLLAEISRNYPSIRSNATANPGGEDFPASFKEYTTWYLMTLLRGPVIALVILFFFDSAELNLTGSGTESALSFDFTNLEHRTTLLLAFVLGLFSRTANHVLEQIMRTLFARAWAEAHDEFEITPGDELKVELGETVVFATSPLTDVTWQTSLGSIDSLGSYTAPKEKEHCNKEAVITAVSKTSTHILKATRVKIVPFKVQGETEVKPTGQYTYSITSGAQVDWSVSPDSGTDMDATTGTYTVPTDLGADIATIKATVKKGEELEGCFDTLEVTIKV